MATRLGDVYVTLSPGHVPVFPRECSCTFEDVTSFGDLARTVVPVTDPDCPIHGGDDDDPVGQCVVCGEEDTVGRLSWQEHDYRHVGWWCNGCRALHGFG